MWKYVLGLVFVILGSILTASIYWIAFGVPLYLLGMIFVLISGRSAKAKSLGLLIPPAVMALLWAVVLVMEGY